jgi:diacylglycerol kinase family enzyme
MTALVNERPFDDPPPLAVVPAGMTNLIAADVGLDGRPEAALKRLISRARQGDLTSLQRPVLTLAADANEAGIHGMFAGAAAFYDAVIWSRRDIQSKGAERNLAVGLAIASLALRSLFGLAERHPAMTGTPMRIAWDNGPLEEHEIFLLMATTLERTLLRVMPFWEDDSLGRPSDADARVRVTSIDYPPRRLARALLPVLRGNPKGWMKTAGYRSGRVRRLSLACRKPIVFDGEFFDAERFGLPEDSPLIMEHRHNLHFVR